MKRLHLAAAAAVLMIAAPVHAANKNNVGCGLGTMLFKGETGKAPQILAATTNGSFGNQTFGISTGTLTCTQNGVVDPPTQVSMFTGANLDRLARDASRGEGESLETLAELMGVADAHKSRFYQTTQANFSTIFQTENATAGDFLASLYGVMAEDAVLSQYVDA